MDARATGFSGVAGLVLALATGCSTPSLSSKPPSVRFVGTETVKTLEAEAFLECASPESRELRERKLQRSSMSRPLYFNDKANSDQPTELDIPVVHTLSLDAYKKLEEQGKEVRPEFLLQLRQRRKVLVAKVYETTTALHDTNDNLVRKEVQQESYPRFYDWIWHPDCKVIEKRPIQFEVRELREQPGLISEGQGLMDGFGRMVFDFRPYIEIGRDLIGGLHFSFTCPSEGLHAEVIIPQDVFMAF